MLSGKYPRGMLTQTKLKVTVTRPIIEMLDKQKWLNRRLKVISEESCSANVCPSKHGTRVKSYFSYITFSKKGRTDNPLGTCCRSTRTCHVHHSANNAWAKLQRQCGATRCADQGRSTHDGVHACMWIAPHPDKKCTPYVAWHLKRKRMAKFSTTRRRFGYGHSEGSWKKVG